MNLRMETVSYVVWSTNPCFANGEMMTVGTRSPVKPVGQVDSAVTEEFQQRLLGTIQAHPTPV
jgi:hypothetical protein